MKHRGGLTILALLIGAPLVGPLMAQQGTPKQQYVRLCGPCHGESGRGNGPAAVGLNPRPRDFTDPSFLAERADKDLIAVIGDGKGAMPAFKAQLSRQQIAQLVAYIREFGKKRK